MKQKLLTLLFAISIKWLMPISLIYADAVCIDGKYYNLNYTDMTAELTYRGSSPYSTSAYSGNVIIPQYVMLDGNRFCVTRIGEYAFNQSTIKSVHLPDSILSIGSDAFRDCYDLNGTLYLPKYLKTIEGYAFFDTGLDSIYVYKDLKEIGKDAFVFTHINAVYYDGSVNDWCKIKMDSPIFSETYGGDLYIKGNKLVHAVIEAGCPDTLKYNFPYCSSLESVVIPEGVKVLSRTFFWCSNLKHIQLPNSLVCLEDNVFNKSALEEVIIPNNVKDVEGFYMCKNLRRVEFGENVQYINYKAFSGCDMLEKVVLGNRVKYIGYEAFYSCDSLKIVSIGDSVTTISEKAFQYCSALQYAKITAPAPPSRGKACFPSNSLIYVDFHAMPLYLQAKWGNYYTLKSCYKHYLIHQNSAPTSYEIEFESDDDDYQIVSCSIDSVDFFDGNRACYSGLDVMSEAPAFTLYVRSNDDDTVSLSFPSFYTSPNISFETYAPEEVYANYARLFGSTNASECENGCGFEYRKADESSSVSSSFVNCWRDSAYMRANVYGLVKSETYKYRPFYKSKTGNYSYGAWEYFTTSDVNSFVISFVNWNGEVLQKVNVAENTLPEYTGDTPVRPEDAEYTYTFKDWSPAIVVATTDATYTATYTRHRKSEAVEQVQSNDPQLRATKILRDGQILILRGDRAYTLTGQEIR